MKKQMYDHKEYSLGFTVQQGPKCYGAVRLKSGRTIYRKYSQELKSGNGLSLTDLLSMSRERTVRVLGVNLMTRLYPDAGRTLEEG